MRYQGTVVDWNEDRGFGFIKRNDDDGKVFVHISSFTGRQRRPVSGDTVSYDLTRDDRGRARAENIAFAGAAPRAVAAIPARASARVPAGSPQWPRPRYSRPARTFPWGGFAAVVLVTAVGVGGFLWYASQRTPAMNATPNTDPDTIRAPRPTVARPKFRCEGKIYCSQMSSCEEAKFYLNNCPGTKMDGDGDRVPCESQWCSF